MSDKQGDSTYNLGNAKFGGGFSGTGGFQSGGTLYDYSSNQNLVEVATEIQKLLQGLKDTNPTATTQKIVRLAIDEISNNPILKAKTITALKSSNTQAFQAAINYPGAENLMSYFEKNLN